MDPTIMLPLSAHRLHPRSDCQAPPSPTNGELIVSNGGVIRGHHAVARFLAKTSSMDPFLAAKIDEWLAFSDKIRIMGVVAASVVNGVQIPAVKEEDRVPAAVKALDDMVRMLSEVLEKHLATETFLASVKTITIADLAVACALVTPFAACVDPHIRESRLLNVTRWLETVLAHDAIKTLLPSGYTFCKTKAYVNAKPAPAATTSTPPSTTTTTTPTTTFTSPIGLFRPARTRVKEALAGAIPVNSPILICGWARTVRGSDAEKLVFIEINDGSCLSCMQIVCVAGENNLSKSDVQAVLDSGQVGASFEIRGTVVASVGKGQALEVKASSIVVLGTIPDAKTYPLAKTKTAHSVEYLRSIAHLRPRTNLISCVARVRHACAMAVHHFFDRLGFAYVHTPIITSADCEGAGEMFQVTTLMNTETRAPPPLDKQGKVDGISG